MPLINCKAELSLLWIDNRVLTTAAIGAGGNATGADSSTFTDDWCKALCSNCYFINRQQCKISKTNKWRI